MILRVRRGLEANRTQFTPALGEPVYTIDTKMLYIGDGVTPGGIPVGAGGGGGGSGVDAIHRADKNNPHGVTKAQVGLGDVPNVDFTQAVAANTAKRSYPLSHQQKLAGVEEGATANATDEELRDRLTHTGTQPMSTVSGLQQALDEKQPAGNYATNADVAASLTSKINAASSSTDNSLPKFDGTSGNSVQSTGVIVTDSDDLMTGGFIESTMIIASPLMAMDEIVEYYEDSGVFIDGVLLKDGIVNGRDIWGDGVKLDGIEEGAQVNSVTSVNGLTGDVVVSGGGEGGGITHHGLLTGLEDDDHTQYHTDARGDARYYQKSEVDTQLSGKSPTSHNHDDLYSPLDHVHDGRYYTESETDSLLAGKAATSHPHTIANVANLQDALDSKQPTGDYATNTALAGKADTEHVHPVGDINATGIANNRFLRGDGTWQIPANTTYAVPSQAEAEAGSATTARAWSAQRVNQAIQTLAPVKPADIANLLGASWIPQVATYSIPSRSYSAWSYQTIGAQTFDTVVGATYKVEATGAVPSVSATEHMLASNPGGMVSALYSHGGNVQWSGFTTFEAASTTTSLQLRNRTSTNVSGSAQSMTVIVTRIA